MDLRAPIESVIPGLRGAVLAVLARTTRPLSQSDVASLVGRYSRSGVRKVLAALADHGVVLAEAHPPAVLYTLNRDHVAAPSILALANLRTSLMGRWGELFADWEIAPVSAVWFGSGARGDGTEHSDIDLLLVRPGDVAGNDEVWGRQIAGLAESTSSWTGNETNIVEYSIDEFRRLWQAGEPFLHAAAQEGITLHGERLATITPKRKAAATAP